MEWNSRSGRSFNLVLYMGFKLPNDGIHVIHGSTNDVNDCDLYNID